ncbi:MAG: sulfatase-like hydrolase/transferase [Holophaga sp.]|nr:sulfatase-like hydrolase/transferase [Holophaga sp.]
MVSAVAINGLRVGFGDHAYYFNLANQAIQLGWPKFLLIYGFPFVILAWFIHFQEDRFRRGLAKARPNGLVLLLIFDEWDYNWTFPHRPSNIRMPEVDRFTSENINFNRTYPPTNETIRSIPSLLTGRVVEDVRTAPGPDLLLRFRGESNWIPWSQVPDLPYQLSNQGLRTCFITHVHAFGPAYMQARPNLEIRRKPYYKEWEEGQARYQTFTGSFVRQWMCVLENLPGISFLRNHGSRVDSVPTVYLHALNETLNAIHSRNFDAIIVHWPIPPAPVMVDPSTGEFTSHPPKGLRLTENLVLVDKTLGRIRHEMESQGLWDTATIVLTSDHWQRFASDPKQVKAPDEAGVEASQQRVPLLIKWPQSPDHQVIRAPMNVVGVARFLASPEASRNLEQLQPLDGHLGSYSPWIK